MNAADAVEIQYFWLVSEESFWLCAYLVINELKWYSVRVLLWWERAYSALENSMLAFFIIYSEAIWNS